MRSGQASHLSAVTGADAPSGDPSLSLGNRGDQVTWSGDRDGRVDEPVGVLSKIRLVLDSKLVSSRSHMNQWNDV